MLTTNEVNITLWNREVFAGLRMQIQTSAQVVIKAEAERVFDASIDCQNLPKFFTGYQAIPAIVTAKTLDGLPLHEGSIRLVDNSDRSSIEEVIVALQRPHSQKYQLVKGFKPPFSWLVRTASGAWSYQPTDGGTQVTWTFKFEPTNPFASMILRLLVQRPFQQAQAICLENLQRYLEERRV